MFGLKWLVDHEVLPKDKLEEYYASYLAGIFRTIRFGIGEAHGQAEMMEFNYLLERGAIKRQSSGTYAIDYAGMPGALADLAKELLDIEATGNRERAEALVQKIRCNAGGIASVFEGGIEGAGGCGPGVLVSGENQVRRFWLLLLAPGF